MTSRIVHRSCPEFAGLPSRLPTLDNVDSAHRSMRRHHRDKRLAAKLDELLGPVDADDERGGLGYMQGRGGIK